MNAIDPQESRKPSDDGDVGGSMERGRIPTSWDYEDHRDSWEL
jgi:hypothetical protein